ncbi:tetratricopeptide repeat protein [Rubrobacter aplysinae]|uniref:tetratricopeptide repeat protein n=1 Tax=Rubrobacter aplysinae TaxID=909625 RepID=UPI00064BFA6A|nr:tetratricopeptide repeat protein [Rubrobacter aplysinae]
MLAGAVLAAVLSVMGVTAEGWVPAVVRSAGENEETVRTLNVYGESLSYFVFGPLTLILTALGLLSGRGKDTGKRSVALGERSVSAGGDIRGNVATGNRYELNFKFGGELYEESAARTSVPSMFGMVPALPETFVGRENDLAELKENLRTGVEDETSAPVQVLTVVHGWPGVGKTTVAAALACDREVEEMFPDGVLFASLGQEPEILSTLVTWARALGAGDLSDAESVSEASARLAAAMREKRALLILDDVWESAHAASLAVGSRRCGTLVTTRLSRVAQEISPRTEGIYRLGVLSKEESLELLRQLALDVVTEHLEESGQLVQELDGLPLAIRVAGGLLAAESYRGLDVPELLEELREGKRLLAAQAPPSYVQAAEQEVPVTVTALLRRSTERLRPLYRKRFAMLGVFPPRPISFDIPAAQDVWDMRSGPRMTLRALTDRGLIEPDGNGRFQMHSLLSAFAVSMIEDDAELPNIRELQLRRLRYYETKIFYFNEAYNQGGDEQRRALEDLNQDYDCIRAAHAWAVAHMCEDEEAARIVTAYASAGPNIFLIRLPPRELIRWIEKAIEAAGMLGFEEDVKAHKANLGAAHAMAGDPRSALPYFEQALRNARNNEDRPAESAALGNLGRAYYSFGDYARAIEYTQGCLEVAREIEEWRTESQALGTLGESYAATGQHQQALRCFKGSRDVSRVNRDSYTEARTLRKLGIFYRQSGNTWRAGVFFKAAASVFGELGDDLECNRTLLSLGILCMNEEEYEEAIDYFERVIAWAEENNDEQSLAVALMDKGNVMDCLGHPDRAEDLYRRAVVSAHNACAPEEEADASFNLAQLIEARNFTEAVALVRRARSLYETVGDPKQQMVITWLRERGAPE